MKTIRVILSYLRWHYTQGTLDLLRNFFNIFWFIFHFFSIGVLTKTLFAPLKRLGMEKGAHFNLAEFGSALIINTIMRVVGFICRSAIILVGLVVLACALAVEAVLVVVWLALPVIVVGFIVKGFELLASL